MEMYSRMKVHNLTVLHSKIQMPQWESIEQKNVRESFIGQFYNTKSAVFSILDYCAIFTFTPCILQKKFLKFLYLTRI